MSGGLIEDLLKLSRVGRAELKRSTVDLSVMAASIVAELRKAELKREIEVGLAQLRRGEGVDGEAFFRRLAGRRRANARRT